MEKIITIGLDLAKSVFQVHAITESGNVATRRKLRRSQVLDFFRHIEPCLVEIETLRQAEQDRRSRCGSNLRGGNTSNDALRTRQIT